MSQGQFRAGQVFRALALGILLSLSAAAFAPAEARQAAAGTEAAARTTWQSLVGRAEAAWSEGQLEAGILLATEALDLARERFGENHPDTLYTESLLGSVLGQNGDYSQAVPLFENVAARTLTQLGPASPDTLIAQLNLAQLHQMFGAPDAALPAFETAYETARRIVRANHPDRRAIVLGLAWAHQEAGDLRRLQDIYEAEASGLRDALGRTAPEVIEAEIALAELQFANRAPDAARRTLASTLAQGEITLEENDPLLIQLLLASARLERAAGNRAQALSAFERVRARASRPDPESVSIRLEALQSLGELWLEAGDPSAAETYYEAWLRLASTSPGTGRSGRVEALLELARLARVQGQLDIAEARYRRVLAEPEATASSSAVYGVSARVELAELLYEQARFEDAVPIYESALDLADRVLGPMHEQTRSTVARLAVLSQNAGLSDKALTFHARALHDSLVFADRPRQETALLRAAHARLLMDTARSPNLSISLMKSALSMLEQAPDPNSSMEEALAFPQGLGPAYGELQSWLLTAGRPYEAARLNVLVRSAGWKSAVAPDRLLSSPDAGGALALFPGELLADRAVSELRQRLGVDQVDSMTSQPDDEVGPNRYAASLAAFQQDLDIAWSNEQLQAAEAAVLADMQAVLPPYTARLVLIPQKPALHIIAIHAKQAESVTRPDLRNVERDILNTRIAIQYEGMGRGNFGTQARLEALYDDIFGAFGAVLSDPEIGTLIIDAGGLFRHLPFAALHDGNGYLVQRYRIIHAPASTGDTGQTDPRLASISASGEGDEVRDVLAGGALSGTAMTTIGGAGDLLASLAGPAVDILHIDNRLRLDVEMPMQARLDMPGEEDPSLKSVYEALLQRTSGIEILALSSSETLTRNDAQLISELDQAGSGQEVEVFSSLVQSNGVRSVFGTLWVLPPERRAILFDRLYTSWMIAGLDKAEALRQTQIAILAQPQTSRPYFWGGIIMFGDGS